MKGRVHCAAGFKAAAVVQPLRCNAATSEAKIQLKRRSAVVLFIKSLERHQTDYFLSMQPS